MAFWPLFCCVSATGWVSCLCITAFAFTQPELARRELIQWFPWFCGLFLVGIPHGALDHRVGSELSRGVDQTPGFSAGPWFYVAYLLAAGLVLLVWFLWPSAALTGFLAIAAIHFGQGDVYWSHQFGLASRSDSLGYRTTLLLTRSLVPVALPFLAHPGELFVPAEVLTGPFLGQEKFSIPPQAIGVGLTGLALLVVLQVGYAGWLAQGGDRAIRRAACFDILETVLLVAMFVVTPPVLAIGVYFNAWHSLRHLYRLILTTHSTRELIATGRWLKAWGLLFKKTLPLTIAAVLLISLLPYLLFRFQVSVANLGLLALVGLSMLTLPHVLVVTWMDRTQGVWSPLPGSNP